MKRIILTIGAALAMTGAAMAQQSFDRQTGGLLTDRDIMTPADLFSLSQTQFNFGTARAMAMAGAFTSLGADASSLAINPAGLGMYRKNEVTFTPMMTFGRSTTPGTVADGKNSTSRFSISDFSVAVNLTTRTRGLVSLTMGIGYNRIADFNYDYAYRRTGQGGSIADVFARQLTWGDLTRDSFYDNNGSGGWNWNRIYPEYWNAALAYRAYMVDDPMHNGNWSPTWIGDSADIGHYTQVKSRGAVGEYTVAFGANIENKFYLGLSIGIQDIRQKLYIDYAEDYLYQGADPGHGYGTDPSLDYQLLYARLNQAMITSGVGVNFKIGAVWRPTAGLRIGAAFHTPTLYSVDRKFQSSAASMAFANNDSDPLVKPDAQGYISSGTEGMTSPLLVDENPDSWNFASPSRLLFGASYTFGSRAIVSVDYERDWYNGIRMKDNPLGSSYGETCNSTFKNRFKGSNTLRAGVEFKVSPVLALRAGYGYSGSMLRDEQTVLAQPAVKKTVYYGAGLGFALSRVCTLDLAYQYMKHTTTDYYLFYASETIERPDGSLEEMFAESSLYRTEFARHNVALTVSFRF